MAAISLLNPKAEFARAAQALAVNITAGKGIQEVMKTNLGPKGTMKMYVSVDSHVPRFRLYRFHYQFSSYLRSYSNYLTLNFLETKYLSRPLCATLVPSRDSEESVHDFLTTYYSPY